MLSQKYFLRSFIISSCFFVFGCGSSNRGIDTQIDTSSLEAFAEKCAEAYVDMKEANPKEFQLFKDAGYVVFDLSQPKDQLGFQMAAVQLCISQFGTVQKAAFESNVNLKTFREMWTYDVKSEIDAALRIYDSYKDAPINSRTDQSIKNGHLTRSVEKIKKLQPLYQGLTGQPYGPKNIEAENGDFAKPTELPLTQKPTEQSITHPVPVSEPNPAQATIPITEKAQPSPQPSWSPSFDCAKASTFSEKAICTDTLLGKLDGALAENYKHMLASDIGDGARGDLKATQRKWLAARNKCIDNQCLAGTYRKRIDEVCEYPVISGVHPVCANSDEIK